MKRTSILPLAVAPGATPHVEGRSLPLSRDAPTWRADAIDFRRQARRRFVRSMCQKIDIADLYADALAAIPETIDGVPPLPDVCPVTLGELLSD